MAQERLVFMHLPSDVLQDDHHCGGDEGLAYRTSLGRGGILPRGPRRSRTPTGGCRRSSRKSGSCGCSASPSGEQSQGLAEPLQVTAAILRLLPETRRHPREFPLVPFVALSRGHCQTGSKSRFWCRPIRSRGQVMSPSRILQEIAKGVSRKTCGQARQRAAASASRSAFSGWHLALQWKRWTVPQTLHVH